MSSCYCAERSHDGAVFTCPICVAKVIESSAFKFLTEAVKAVSIDRSVSVSASSRREQNYELPNLD